MRPALLSPQAEARVNELVTAAKMIQAVKVVREHTNLSLPEAKDLVGAMAAELQAPSPRPVVSRSAVPAQDAGRDGAGLTVGFAAALRQARRLAGDPSYRLLATQVKYSAATISRAFSGRNLPRWKLAESLLRSFGIPEEQIQASWRDQWVQAIEEHQPVGLKQHTTFTSEPAEHQSHDDGELRRAQPTNSPGGQELPAGQECEDCGAWITSLVQHQAWHWNIERQLRKAVIRAVDGKGPAARKS